MFVIIISEMIKQRTRLVYSNHWNVNLDTNSVCSLSWHLSVTVTIRRHLFEKCKSLLMYIMCGRIKKMIALNWIAPNLSTFDAALTGALKCTCRRSQRCYSFLCRLQVASAQIPYQLNSQKKHIYVVLSKEQRLLIDKSPDLALVVAHAVSQTRRIFRLTISVNTKQR